MRIPAREMQLSNDLMALQRGYNLLVIENTELKAKFAAATKLSEEKEELLNKEILRLSELLKRAKSFESPRTTLSRKAREAKSKISGSVT